MLLLTECVRQILKCILCFYDYDWEEVSYELEP